MAAAQDWCLQCGAGAPGSLGATGDSWRSTAILASVLVLLLAGAAGAAYAAWGKKSASKPATTTLARGLPLTGSPQTAPPTTALPGGAGAPATGATGTTGTPGALALRGLVKPPKIPLKTPTPKVTLLPTTVTKPAETGATTKTTTTTPATTGGSTPSEPTAMLLDTNAAATYNPYSYPATNFGDPRLAIDSDKHTGWTAQVEPSVAPKLAEGLVIDLRSRASVARVKLYTSTPGMTVQIFGAIGEKLPASITEKAWIPLSHTTVAKKKSTTISLRDSTQTFRWFLLWISRAPASSVGTPEAPGRVVVDEYELFPPK
jgi:hypothetical protein